MTDDQHVAQDTGSSGHIKRRTFVGATVAAGGAVVAIPLLQGCSDDQVTQPGDDGSSVRMNINGQDYDVPVDNRTSLLDMLRERAGLTGTKKGCDQGACGACTVLVDDQRVLSCLTLAVMVDGAEVVTIEGVARDGELHPLQQAFIDEDGFQCGFCTPGQIMSGIGCIREGHTSSSEEIREWMSGNICRCGAYANIVAAVARTAPNGA